MNDRIALDRATTRTIDPQSGHLHVSSAPISKACVNPYNGREIPGFEALGLNANRVYNLLRDPAELEKAAPTFEGKPLLSVHKPQSANDHDHEVTVGSVSGVRWEAPYLMAALAVWDGEDIAAIDADEKRELSSGYFYDPVMEPGSYEGVPYDGRMTNIRGNHVALVSEGRAGKDVCVGDEAITTTNNSEITMAKHSSLSRAAVLAAGALHPYLKSKMATDAKLDLGVVLKGVTSANWKASKPKIKTALDKALVGKLAQDADIADVVELLDQLDAVTEEVAEAVAADPAAKTVAATDDDADMVARLKEVLKAKGMSDEDIASVCAAMKPEVKADPVVPATDTEEKKPEVTKTAMDAAIAAAVKANENATVARMMAIRQAEDEVRPRIGKVAALDSAAAVYKLALDAAKIDLTGVPEAAFGALFRALPAPNAGPKTTPRVAMDAAAAADYAKRFPNANRLAR